MKSKVLVIVACVVLFPFPTSSWSGRPNWEQSKSQSKAMSGNQLLEDCNEAVKEFDGKDSDFQRTVQCTVYVAGVIDGYLLAKIMIEQQQKLAYCPPTEGWNNKQSVRIVAKWMKENPENLHYSASFAVLSAMSKAFPCQ